MKKINMKKIIIVLLGLLLINSIIINNFFSKELIDDYYTYINQDMLDSMEIEDGELGWSRFSLAQEKVDSEVENIVNDLIKNNTNPDINILYKHYLDIDSRDKNGLGILNYYISLIESSKNINEFINNAIKVENNLYIDIFTRATVAPDFKDTSKNIVYFYPVTFDFGVSGDMYINPDYSRYHAILKQSQIKLLKEFGYDKKKAREVSGLLDDFFIDVSSVSKTEEDLSDVDSLYNVITKDELQNIYSNIDINKYLKLMGIQDEKYFSIVDKDNYIKINSYLKDENLFLLKEYVKIKILENYSGYTTTNYAGIIDSVNNQLLGISSNDNLEDKASNLISAVFSSNIDKIYLENNFSDNDKKKIEELVFDIISYYENSINSNTWMDDNTKNKAILKLKNIKINIGGNYENIINYNFSEESILLDNILLINKIESNKLLIKLKENDVESIISPTIVNAYYNPLDNSINFPASLKELYKGSDNYYELLGSMGMIIAHEITHAFDNNGSKFDELGNRVNWWSSNDYSKFLELQERIINYYEDYEILGINIDGRQTVGENIADLGAINAIASIAKEKGAKTEELRDMFSSYASLWVYEYIESYEKLLLLSDTHAPNKIRVNAVLSSCDIFYEVYNITNKDLMYIDKNNRVKIW